MSTKIYNGWRVDDVSLEELLSRLMKFGKSVQKTAQKFVLSTIARLTTRAIDYHLCTKKKRLTDGFLGNDSVLSHYMWKIDRYVDEAEKSDYRSFFDIKCEVVAIPVLNGKKKTILLLLYACRENDYKAAFKRIVKAKPYYYFNNTDRPRHISEKDWDARGELWDKALGGNGTAAPSECGFTFSCTTRNTINMFALGRDMAKKLASLAPSFKERVKDVAYDIAFEKAEAKLLRRKKVRSSDVRDFMKTKQGKALIAKEKKRADLMLRGIDLINKMFDTPAKKLLKADKK